MKRSKLWSQHNVPGDLWPQILARLPVKTLLRFRSVKKEWLALINDPDFALLHLRLYTNNRSENRVLVLGTEEPLEVACLPSLDVTATLHIPQTIIDMQIQYDNWYHFSSINGLIMLSATINRPYSQLTLWNPATRKTLLLPPTPSPPPPLEVQKFVDLGLGFDPSSKDYKHVRLTMVHPHGLHSIAVYFLATNSWKMIPYNQGTVIRCLDFMDDTSLFLKGIVYSIARVSYCSTECLISFDLMKEKLASIRLPVDDVYEDEVYDRDLSFPRLTMVDGGCSLAVVFCLSGSRSVWVLEGLGTDDINSRTWTKRYSFSSEIVESKIFTYEANFFYLTNNDELLILLDTRIVSYNLKTKEEKVIVKNRCENKGVPYIESLVAIPSV